MAGKSASNSASFSIPIWVSFLAITLAVAWVYGNVRDFGFTNWDDPTYVRDNPLIRAKGWGAIQELFSVFLSGNYHPLVLLSYWMEIHGIKDSPVIFHTTNLILHGINAGLLVFILKRWIPILPATLGALVFAVHPLHVESVAWITERKDVLYTFFLCLSWIAWLQFNKSKYNNYLYYILSIVLFIASGLSKGQAVVLVPILMVGDWLSGQSLYDKRWWMRLAPFIVLAMGIGVLAIYAQQHHSNVRIQQGYGFFEQFLAGGYAFSFYVQKVLLPLRLSAFYVYPALTDGIPISLIIGAITGFALIGTAIWFWRKDKPLLAAFAWLFLPLFPVLQFLPVGNAIAADRYMYVPMIGVAFGFGVLFHRLSPQIKKYPWVIAAAILSIGTWGYLARQRTMVWKDSFSLWQDVIVHYPEAAIAWNSLANAYYDQQQYPQAIQYFEEALLRDSSDIKTYNNLGNSYDKTGNPQKAIPLFLKALHLKPEDAMAWTNLGVTYEHAGLRDSAIVAHTRSVELSPSPLGYANLGNVLERAGQLEASEKYCRKALEMDPNYALAHNNLGVALYRMGRVPEAIESLKMAARLGYPSAQAYLSENGISW